MEMRHLLMKTQSNFSPKYNWFNCAVGWIKKSSFCLRSMTKDWNLVFVADISFLQKKNWLAPSVDESDNLLFSNLFVDENTKSVLLCLSEHEMTMVFFVLD